MTKNGKKLERIANIDRSVVLDPSTAGVPVDQDAGDAGEWESSGILDVSGLFGEEAGTLFLFDVEAHGIEDQDDFNTDSQITDFDLGEGGQLSFLIAPYRNPREHEGAGLRAGPFGVCIDQVWRAAGDDSGRTKPWAMAKWVTSERVDTPHLA